MELISKVKHFLLSSNLPKDVSSDSCRHLTVSLKQNYFSSVTSDPKDHYYCMACCSTYSTQQEYIIQKTESAQRHQGHS